MTQRNEMLTQLPNYIYKKRLSQLLHQPYLNPIIEGSTITIKSLYMITSTCQNFDVRDVNVQIPKQLLLHPFLFKQNGRLLIWQKLIMKFHSKKIHTLILRIDFKKYIIWRKCKALFFSHFLNIIISYIFPRNFIEIHQVSWKIVFCW